MESNSSNAMMYNLSGFFEAGRKIFLIFSSLCPTYLFNNSGPLIMMGSSQFIIFFKLLIKRVLPDPGGPYGPYNKTPLTWHIPNFLNVLSGIILVEKTRVKISINC